MNKRVGSSMVEQRPFKALVAGSSPAQPKILGDHFFGGAAALSPRAGCIACHPPVLRRSFSVIGTALTDERRRFLSAANRTIRRVSGSLGILVPSGAPE
jgi:hypothetical protein